jgi:hypothetical protein
MIPALQPDGRRRHIPLDRDRQRDIGRLYGLSLPTDPVARMRLVRGDHERRPWPYVGLPRSRQR